VSADRAVPGTAGPTVQAFGLGQAKSGTASLVGLLARDHRAEHEPEREAVLHAATVLAAGTATVAAVADWLRERDRRLRLRFDISFANQFLLEPLLRAFPAATFVVQVRDPYTWLESVVCNLLHRPLPPEVRAFLPIWFRPEQYEFTRHDRGLQRRGLYPLAAFAAAWSRHLDACLALAPFRRLVLRTHELDGSLAAVATFLRLPVASLDAASGRLNPRAAPFAIESVVPRQHLEDTVAACCGAHRDALFPGIGDLDRARALWTA